MQGRLDLNFYRGKRVLVTGHTGFKGAWLCRILQLLGAEVTGYALQPPTAPALFELARVGDGMHSVIGDVRDLQGLRASFAKARPEVLFHLAAQPIVREGYRDPHTTFESNVMGTVNVLECARACDTLRSAVIVTTDKVYENGENGGALQENDRLGGADPYSASKACAELVAQCYRTSFLGGRAALSTVRAGNVIGGGDFAPDRILPDCVRAFLADSPLSLRNPDAVRPYQHVLEPLFAYLEVAARQASDHTLAGCYNVGPREEDSCTTGELVALFEKACGKPLDVRVAAQDGLREAQQLRLDSGKLARTFAWAPTWDLAAAVARTVAWTKAFAAGEDVRAVMDVQIREFMEKKTEER